MAVEAAAGSQGSSEHALFTEATEDAVTTHGAEAAGAIELFAGGSCGNGRGGPQMADCCDGCAGGEALMPFGALGDHGELGVPGTKQRARPLANGEP